MFQKTQRYSEWLSQNKYQTIQNQKKLIFRNQLRLCLKNLFQSNNPSHFLNWMCQKVSMKRNSIKITQFLKLILSKNRKLKRNLFKSVLLLKMFVLSKYPSNKFLSKLSLSRKILRKRSENKRKNFKKNLNKHQWLLQKNK